MKKYIYPFAVTAAMLTAASCDDNEILETPIPDSQKEMISFSLSDGASQTRAGFTGADTKIVMRIQSNEKNGSGVKYTRTCALAKKDDTNDANSYSAVTFTLGSTNYTRYWDDAHGRKSLLSVYAIAVPNKNNDNTLPNSTLSAGDNTDENAWGSVPSHELTWQVDENQTTTNIEDKDLVYSNNICADAEKGKNGIYRWDYSAGDYSPNNTGATTHKDGQMLFFQNGMSNPSIDNITDAAGHFDRGHMVFNHALTRLSVKLIEGTGFISGNSSDFQFATSTNIKLLNVPYNGKFDVDNGSWQSGATIGNISSIAATTSSSDASGTYMAQILPGYVFAQGSSTNVMEMTIDDNTYYITQDMLFTALKANAGTGEGKNGLDANATSYTMEQGKNYNFSITINKKAIENITATLIDWSKIDAGHSSINNGHINISTYSATGSACSDLHLYRNAQDLGSINTSGTYTANKYRANYLDNTIVYYNKPTQTSTGSNIWKTSWYFEDNRTAYHIRSINSTAYGTSGNNVKNPSSDSKYTYFEMQNGAQSDHDYHWGAPMNTTSSDKFKYDENNGFSEHLHQGITAINDGQTIKITELHMMSNINVVLKTSTGTDAVQLRTGSSESDYRYATVALTRLYSKAQVDMGIGLVTMCGSISDSETMTNPINNTTYSNTYFDKKADNSENTAQTKPFTWAVVPQKLWRGNGDAQKTEEYYVGITITTPDNNQYYVIKNLSEITATTVGTSNNQVTNEKITRWYPNHSYTYTITITKKGIESITCSLVAWSEVNAGNTDINLEN